MADAVIRTAILNDLAGLLALYRHLHGDDVALGPVAAEQAWSALLSSGLVVPIVADVAGLLVSSCTLALIPNMTRGARPYGVIENVVTHTDHRWTGLGQAVMRAALRHAWSAGCYKVMLATGSRRASTLSFYERAGFQRGSKTHFEARNPKMSDIVARSGLEG